MPDDPPFISEGRTFQIASDLARPFADHLTGAYTVRFVSPKRLVAAMVATCKHAPPDSAERMSKRRDVWVVSFKERLPDGVRQIPDSLIVEVDAESGAARIVPGM